MSSENWQLAYVLPNLQLQRSFEFTDLAFVSNDDERLTAIRGQNNAARSLLDGFRDIGGGHLKPAVAIYRTPSRITSLWEAIADARNCIALSCVLNGWQVSVGQLNNFLIRDSDYFDFYRRWPSQNGKSFCYQGSALETVSPVPHNFTGQPHTYIPPCSPVFSQPEPDQRILIALQRVWERVHILRKTHLMDYRRLRSLSVAYEACRVPQEMDNPIYDHGKHCSFWIAALETLAHRVSRGASMRTVLQLIGHRQFSRRAIRCRRRVVISRRSGNPNKRFLYLNLIQRFCKKLYDARNSFLQGNRLRMTTFVPGNLKTGVRLLDIAPLVYLGALEADLIPQRPPTRIPTQNLNKRQLRRIFQKALSGDKLEDALCRVIES